MVSAEHMTLTKVSSNTSVQPLVKGLFYFLTWQDVDSSIETFIQSHIQLPFHVAVSLTTRNNQNVENITKEGEQGRRTEHN